MINITLIDFSRSLIAKLYFVRDQACVMNPRMTINKHSWIRIESLYFFLLFLFSLYTNDLIRLNKTFFLTNRERHFFQWVAIVVKLLKLISIGTSRPVLVNLINFLVLTKIRWFHSKKLFNRSFNYFHLFWTFNFKHVQSNVCVSCIEVVNFVGIVFNRNKNNLVFIFKCFISLNAIT